MKAIFNNKNILVSDIKDWKIGDSIEVYASHPILIQKDGVYHPVRFKGTIKSITSWGVNISLASGIGEASVNFEDIFSKKQSEVLVKAIKDKIGNEELKLISNHRFTAEQMEEIRFGFKDGLSVEEVWEYAKPEIEAWKMDLYRYGLEHGIGMKEIERMLAADGSDITWIVGRNKVDSSINDKRIDISKNIKEAGFESNKKIVLKIENLNHLTKRNNSIKDIADVYKNHTYSDSDNIQGLINEIGKELKVQELNLDKIIER